MSHDRNLNDCDAKSKDDKYLFTVGVVTTGL